MSAYQFAKAWDHKISIKHIFMDSPELPPVADTVKMAAAVVDAVRKLQAQLPQDGDLYWDLDNCVDEFEDITGTENDYEARDRFNDALHQLYDEADCAKRVWIE